MAAALLAATDLAAQCNRTFVANVVAIEQFIWYNRLGAHEPDQLMYVLQQDLVSSTGGAPSWSNHRLRPGKRPRPLVLRVNAGSCLRIHFRNWLNSAGGLGTSAASVHVVGMQLVNDIEDDGSHVGVNPTSLVEPGQDAVYTLFAEREGTFLMYSTAQTTGADGDGGQIAKGLFGAVNVEPAGAEFYRSQLSRVEMDLATRGLTSSQHPIINYDSVFPSGHPEAGRPVVRMTKGDTIVHGDLNAIITGPNRGNFPASSFPNPGVQVYNHIAADSRLKPFREFTVIFHDEVGLVQAFDSIFDSQQFAYTLHGGRDAFAVNYGTGGIGAEILANRFRLGPMWDCNECKFEEFFLSSWVVGDPAMVVDQPAAADFRPSSPPPPGPRATLVRYPQDPSNVFHSYLNDHVKIRNLHAGPKEHHVFHLHAHQWLHTPNSDGSNYHDSQAIGPGAGYTYEITYGGGGNRNDTPGDAILHCHFYPHFAQGMWGLWRVHDVFERGTVLDGNGRPVAGARALPDGEIATGTPIPGVVPMPTYALAPLPTPTHPGYPFFIPGVAGHRPPKPPLDTRFDGGLPRHVVFDGTAAFPALNTRDFSKQDLTLGVNWLPEIGTQMERDAMTFHEALGYTTPVADQWTSTSLFHTNGLPRRPGAPFADPCGVRGVPMGVADSVKAAAFQLDTIWFNKARWFFTQHRMFGLWSDVASFRAQTRAPEPLFFRVHDNTCLTYHLVNLVPDEYDQDDFQVQTPTDVIGQHIHLVKFDVTSSDGAGNGWNYEDGTFAPNEVTERIHAINGVGGLDL
ncbi:MAG TPA: multicopper oxidase domain-containing protein, partial [Longimicrobium sp.]|nr:multicopper oxidase domain-containing protein [Longimicrobium sp.]